MPDNEILVEARWRTVHAVEVPDGVDPRAARDAVRGGELPDWLAEQLGSGTAELVDWDVL